jgi:hypothetical protein
MPSRLSRVILIGAKNSQEAVGRHAENRLVFLLWRVKHDEDPALKTKDVESYHAPLI